MSHNSHTLLLFFDKEDLYKNCLRMFKLLDEEAPEKAKEIGRLLDVNIAQAWKDDWFNQSITPTSKFLRLDYDTSTGYDLPLDVLQQLFDAGLRAACLEVFYDQVGEFGQFYFMDGQLVDKDSVCKKFGRIRSIVDEQFENDNDQLDQDEYIRPTPITKLIKEKTKHEKEASEMVDSLIGLAKASSETGVNPLELAKSAMVLRAAGKGLLQAVGFGIVTILLFKGMWLWISLTVVLLVALPLIYVSNVSDVFGDDEDGDNKNNEGEEPC